MKSLDEKLIEAKPQLVAWLDDWLDHASLLMAAAEQGEKDRAIVSALEDRIRVLEEDLRQALRRQEMFRHALFVYLQERDGPAGAGAPTPETLSIIRTLVEGATA